MRPVAFCVSPDVEVSELIERLDEQGEPVPVVDADLVGVVDLGLVLRWARLGEELQVPLGPARPATI
jgi:CBS domain-containing protein